MCEKKIVLDENDKKKLWNAKIIFIRLFLQFFFTYFNIYY